MLKIKRIYEPAAKEDGYRILIDRLWPRGISKEEARIDRWLKDIAPSDELRKWFNHDPERWAEFERKFWQELQENSDVLQKLKEIIAQQEVVTLLYAAKDEQHNNAIALSELLQQELTHEKH